MLGIHGVGRDRADYYLSDLARELPVSGPGRWAGTAAEGLGLGGTGRARGVPPAAREPASGRGSRARDRDGSPWRPSTSPSARRNRPACSSHWAAPTRRARSWPRTPRRSPARSRISSSTASPPPGGPVPARAVLPTSGALAAVFTHGVSRNGDPHLHSHVVLANLVHGGDGRWSACDRRGIDAHRMAASAVYEAHLRAGSAPRPSACAGPAVPGARPRSRASGRSCWANSRRRGADIRRHMYERGVHARPGRPHRLGGDPSRQGARRTLRRPRGPLAATGPRRRRPPGARARPRARRGPAVLDEHRFAGVICPHRPRRGPPSRRRGGIRRGRPRRRHRLGSSSGSSPTGCPPGPARSGRAAAATPHGRPGQPPPARPGPPSGRPRRPRGVARRRPRPGRLPGQVGPGATRRSRSATARRTAWPPCRPSRLADHVRTEREVAAARARLGWREPVSGGAWAGTLTQRPRPRCAPGAPSCARRREELAPG